MCAKASYEQAKTDVETLTGIRVSAKTQERIVKRNPLGPPEVNEPVTEISLDGGMVRLVSAQDESSEWKQYKAVRLNGTGVGMAWLQANGTLLEWLQSLLLMSLIYCLGDGHVGIWSLFEQLNVPQIQDHVLDWFHLMENLHKVEATPEQLQQAEALLWEGQVDKTITLLSSVKTAVSQRFQVYLQNHRGRIPNYWYYQMEGLPISSSPVESWIKQIDERIQITGARWKPENAPQILALRCAYLNDRIDDLFSLSQE